MERFEQLVKALLSASKVSTAWEKLMRDAATAIEELDAEETRLLLITSELQDKVVELEEELNDADIAADDNAWQVEELQAEVERLQAQLPKRGEWIPMTVSSGRDSWKCSVCGRRARGKIENIPYCHCGAKMDIKENANG